MRDGTGGRRSGVTFLVTAGLAASVLLMTVAAGCGQAGQGSVPENDTSPTATAAPISTSAPTSTSATGIAGSTSSTASSASSDSEQVFARLAANVRPMAVFAPSVLPQGAVLADRWLPVIEFMDPALYDGPERANPYVVGSGTDSEIQVVFTVGKGWLVVIENFHGDLGDVAGVNIGAIEGSPAALFEVNGGELVQWSKDGRWYGVFARSVSRDVLLATALGMRMEG